MKNVLLTGANSYIGTSIEKWLSRWATDYTIDTLDMVDRHWSDYDFHGYDTVFHVAGIVHRNNVPSELYDNVNNKLAVNVASRAAESGVRQFIFMSTAAVYATSDSRNPVVAIDENSKFAPSTEYGRSKKNAEDNLLKMRGEQGFRDFRIVIIRSPVVYGRKATGNYARLSKIAQKTVIFPKINNIRSMIYIDNLCEFIRLTIDNECDGIFLPQNREYVCISTMVKMIAQQHGRKILLTNLFNPAIRVAAHLIRTVNKVFGTYYYDNRISGYFNWRYCVTDFKESIVQCEN